MSKKSKTGKGNNIPTSKHSIEKQKKAKQQPADQAKPASKKDKLKLKEKKMAPAENSQSEGQSPEKKNKLEGLNIPQLEMVKRPNFLDEDALEELTANKGSFRRVIITDYVQTQPGNYAIQSRALEFVNLDDVSIGAIEQSLLGYKSMQLDDYDRTTATYILNEAGGYTLDYKVLDFDNADEANKSFKDMVLDDVVSAKIAVDAAGNFSIDYRNLDVEDLDKIDITAIEDELFGSQSFDTDDLTSALITGDSTGNYKIEYNNLDFEEGENLKIEDIEEELLTYHSLSFDDLTSATITGEIGGKYQIDYRNIDFKDGEELNIDEIEDELHTYHQSAVDDVTYATITGDKSTGDYQIEYRNIDFEKEGEPNIAELEDELHTYEGSYRGIHSDDITSATITGNSNTGTPEIEYRNIDFEKEGEPKVEELIDDLYTYRGVSFDDVTSATMTGNTITGNYQIEYNNLDFDNEEDTNIEDLIQEIYAYPLQSGTTETGENAGAEERGSLDVYMEAGSLEPSAEPETSANPDDDGVVQDLEAGEIEFTVPASDAGSLEVGDENPYNSFGFGTAKAVPFDPEKEAQNASPITGMDGNGAGSLDPNNPAVSVNMPSATKPNVQWIGSPNYFEGRGGQKVVAVCSHIMQSGWQQASSWFQQTQDADKRVSSTFGITLDGRILQWVKEEDTSWANGPVIKPDPNLNWFVNGVSGNRMTISIEHEGMSGAPFPEPMYQATLALHKYLVSKYNLPIDRNHLVGHYQIDSVNKQNCPGKGMPWDRLMSDLNTWAGSSSTTITLVPVKYTATLSSVATVRSGPGRSYQVLKTVPFDPGHKYEINGEAHGEAIATKLQASGTDDVWAYLPEIGGFVTRTIIKQ